MSDTTGWHVSKRKVMYKYVGDKLYELHEAEPGGGLWYVTCSTPLVEAYTLADAKRAAHRHAEGRCDE